MGCGLPKVSAFHATVSRTGDLTISLGFLAFKPTTEKPPQSWDIAWKVFLKDAAASNVEVFSRGWKLDVEDQVEDDTHHFNLCAKYIPRALVGNSWSTLTELALFGVVLDRVLSESLARSLSLQERLSIIKLTSCKMFTEAFLWRIFSEDSLLTNLEEFSFFDPMDDSVEFDLKSRRSEVTAFLFSSYLKCAKKLQRLMLKAKFNVYNREESRVTLFLVPFSRLDMKPGEDLVTTGSNIAARTWVRR